VDEPDTEDKTVSLEQTRESITLVKHGWGR